MWKKIFLKHKSCHSLTWKVARDDIVRPIWRLGEKRCIIWSQKFELDLHFGKLNPKLSFSLYPCGEFKDANKAVTMAVQIVTPSKCPPLPPSSKLRLSLVVREDDGEAKKPITVEEKLNMNTFYICNVISLSHDDLKVSVSKYFYFDIEASCSLSGLHESTGTFV